jgi:glycosyltransferase A (GT-A) superfamily protein (DUF2064 family)
MSAIAIFVKTPGISPVKSRLAASIGAARAVQCHLRCAKTVAAIAVAAGVGPVYWAVAESEGLDDPNWSQLPRLLQAGEGLGSRMRSVHDELCRRHGAGILIGADLPQLEVRWLHAADHHMQAGPAHGVIGPARDGGFWLMGANAPLPPPVWEAPTYGGAEVASDFMLAPGNGLNWIKLGLRSDLDHHGDLQAVIDELRDLPEPHPLQVDLLQWLPSLHEKPTQASASNP